MSYNDLCSENECHAVYETCYCFSRTAYYLKYLREFVTHSDPT